MGHKVSTVAGVKSENFTEPGNAINEIWVGNTEIISRLPFGDSDMAQAGWPKNGAPKIPWHNFIIPMKRDLEITLNLSRTVDWNTVLQTPSNKLICCNGSGCIANDLASSSVITTQLINQNPTYLLAIFFLSIFALAFLWLSWSKIPHMPQYDPTKTYNAGDLRSFALKAYVSTVCTLFGSVIAAVSVVFWIQAHQAYAFYNWDSLLVEYAYYFLLAVSVFTATWNANQNWKESLKVSEDQFVRDDSQYLAEKEQTQSFGGQSTV